MIYFKELAHTIVGAGIFGTCGNILQARNYGSFEYEGSRNAEFLPKAINFSLKAIN